MEQSQKLVSELVEDFKANEHAYLLPSYQESQVRQDFIDKFFSALGWDVTHNIQKNPYQQEVKIENKVTVGSSQRRADYAFSIAPNFEQVKFFVEAKKPSRSLANPDDYFQTIRYAWNTKTPISVLTDFEEFHILDCRHKPKIDDALNRKIESFHYSDYTKEEIFAKIYHLFARDAVLSGSLDQFISQLQKRIGKNPANYQPVDDAFLEELDEYRVTLAKAFKKTNERLQGEELTEAVQRTIDRLVFIRFLEDKGIEDRQIVKLANQKSPWQAFVTLCKRLDPKYNGLVFKPHRILDSGEFNSPDEKPFAQICRELSDPASPYDFNQIPVSILGSIYERFLGKVVHATDKRVKVEEKPEVRKAGGVYYTPEYIVRYIVKETIGKVIEGKTPKEISKMAFADIACGSGSFLIEVYQQLLEYHIRYYNEHPDEATDENTFTRNGVLQLTLKLKKEILVNNIYGVDLDYQATEVTQMSLYLKMLEQATMQDAHQFGLFKERILPDLRKNIVCGNSLVGRDIIENELFSHVDENSLKMMDFEDIFPDVVKRGGFDVIVGNPPYIRIQSLNESSPESVNYFKKKYKAALSGNYDIYVIFVERALQLLKATGKLGYILPHKFFNANYGQGLRKHIAEGKYLEKVVHYGDQQIFKGATTYTCLLFLTKNKCAQIDIEMVADLSKWLTNGTSLKGTIFAEDLTSDMWHFAIGGEGDLLKKLISMPTKLADVTERIFQGIKTSADKIYILDELKRENNCIQAFSPQLQKDYWFETDLLHPLIKGGDSKRYVLKKTKRMILFPYCKGLSGSKLISESEMIEKYPLTWQYLRDNKKFLENREDGKMKGSNWYGYVYPKALDVMALPKIFTPDIAAHASFSYDMSGELFFTGGVSGGYGVIPKDNMSNLFLLALLNSRLLEWMIEQTATQMRGGYYSYESRFIKNLPIRELDIANPFDKAKYDQIIRLVELMHDAKQKIADAKTEGEINRIEIYCQSIESQIDDAVYSLYGLADEEISIIKKSNNK